MLDPTASTPLYTQLMDTIEQQILSGERAPGERLPTEGALAQEFGVSLITVRHAMSGLCEKGLVDRKQGKGTFVRQLKHTRDIRKLEGFSDSCLRQGLHPGGQMLENRQVLLSDKLAVSLGQPAGSQGIFISRLRFADQMPVAIEKNYFPMRYLSLLGQRFDDNSLFQYLKEQEKVTVARADKRIELCHATPNEGELLLVPPGTPMLYVKSITYDQAGIPLYVGSQVMNGEKFSLQLTQYATN